MKRELFKLDQIVIAQLTDRDRGSNGKQFKWLR